MNTVIYTIATIITDTTISSTITMNTLHNKEIENDYLNTDKSINTDATLPEEPVQKSVLF